MDEKITVMTSSGFTCEVDADANDDMELLDLLVELKEGDILAYSKAATLLLGNENKKKLYDHVRNNAGRVTFEAFEKELSEIIDSMAGGKKKS